MIALKDSCVRMQSEDKKRRRPFFCIFLNDTDGELLRVFYKEHLVLAFYQFLS